MIDERCPERVHPEHWEVAKLRDEVSGVFDLNWTESDDELRDFAREELRQRMVSEAGELIRSRQSEVGEDEFLGVARMYLLQYVDQLWKDHLLAMDRLRQGVSVRAYGQRNPLLEYKREAYHMFLTMEAMRDEKLLTKLTQEDLDVFRAASASQSKSTARRLADGTFTLPDQAGGLDAIRAAASRAQSTPEPRRPQPGDEALMVAAYYGLSRNDPCPCGSGKKIKKCCGEGRAIPVLDPAAVGAPELSAGEADDLYDAPDEVADDADLAIDEPAPEAGLLGPSEAPATDADDDDDDDDAFDLSDLDIDFGDDLLGGLYDDPDAT